MNPTLPSEQEADLLPVAQVADLLRINRRTLQRWIKGRLLTKTGRRVSLSRARHIAEFYRVNHRRGPRLGSTPNKRSEDDRERIAIYRDYYRANRISKSITRLGMTGLQLVADALQKALQAKAEQAAKDPVAAMRGS